METEQKQLEKSALDVELWKSLLTADMNARYWSLIGKRYVGRDKNVKIFLAITSSSIFAGWGIWSQVPLAWKILSAILPLATIIFPYLKYQDIISKASDAAGTWMQIQFDYESLQLARDTKLDGVEALLMHYSNIKRREVKANLLELGLPPIDRELLELCYSQVLVTRELSE